MFYGAVGRVGVRGLVGGFSPASLFAAGEQGVWYDPSDLTTMFQDSAGTTPVTAVEQPVGLLLDKSQGLVLGPELVTNGDFSNGLTGWINGGGWVADNNTAKHPFTPTDRSLTQGAAIAGKSYLITYDVVNYIVGGLMCVTCGGVTGVLANRTNGSYREIITATGTGAFGIVAGGTWQGSIDNISVKLLSGNHATQSTTASRPVLSARVNQLTYSEQFGNAAWTKVGVTASGARITATAGTSAAYAEQSVFNVPATTMTVSVVFANTVGRNRYAWVADRGVAPIASATFDLNAVSVVGKETSVTASAVTLSDGSVRCTVTYVRSSAGTSGPQFALAGSTYTSDRPVITWSGGEFLDANIDLRPTNQTTLLPAYQRIAAATDYNTTGFPYYLRADGVDDRLLGPAISNIISASAYEACIGARVLAVSTSSGNPWVNQSLMADGLAYVGIGYMTTANIIGGYNFDGNVDTVTQAMTPPSTFVLQQRHDGGNLVLALNGGSEASAASGNTSVITGETRIFSSNGSVSVQAQLYSLIIRSTAFTATERANTLTYVNSKTLAY